MRYRRSLLASFLVIVLTALLLSACSNNNKENKLSELEDIKLNQYMTDSGITIPESVDMDTIRSIIIELEDNPEHPAPIVGDTLIADLYEDIRNLVVEYEAGKVFHHAVFRNKALILVISIIIFRNLFFCFHNEIPQKM